MSFSFDPKDVVPISAQTTAAATEQAPAQAPTSGGNGFSFDPKDIVPLNSAIPKIDTTNMSAQDKIDLYKALRSDKSVNINGVDTATLGDVDRYKLANDVANSSAPTTAGSITKEILSGPPAWADDGINALLPGSSIGAFVHEVRDSMHADFLNEIKGVQGVMGDAIDGKIGSVNDVIDSYRGNRDLSKLQSTQDFSQHPISSLLGQITGGVANPAGASVNGAMDATKLGKTLLDTAPTFYKWLAKPAAQGAFYGFLYGSGNSDADLTKGEFAPYLKQTATTMGWTILGATALQNSLGRLADSGRLNFLDTGPDGTLNKGAALNTLATNGGKGPLPSSIPKALFDTTPTQVQSKAADAMDTALNYNLVDPKAYGIKDTVTPGQDTLWNTFRDYFLSGNNFDYQNSRVKLATVQDNIGSQIDDILNRAQGNNTHDLESIFGPGYASKVQKGFTNASLGGDAYTQSAQSLNELSSYLDSGQIKDLSTLRTMRQFLGDSIQWDPGKDTKYGSSQYALKGMYNNLNRYLDGQIRTNLPDEFNTWKTLNSDSSNLELFDHALQAGSLAKTLGEAQAAGYNQSVGQGPNPIGSLLGQAYKGTTTGGLINAGVSLLTGPAGRIPAAGLQNTIGRPPALAAVISSIMPSYTSGKLMAPQDKQIGGFYIDNNGTLSAREKATQKYKLNTTGEFDINNIPNEVMNDAKKAQNQQ